MKITDLFVKTTKNIPADEQAVNAKLLIQAGYVHKEMAGVYSYLPLGLMVLENIKKIVREEMNSIGSSELIMTSLQRKELWEKTNRWSDKEVDVWFKSRLKNGTEVGFGWSHEEPITDMMRNFVSSYRDLPIYVYQFQTKLRNELRAKSGIMRGREFVMKDLYSYSLTEEDHEKFYQQVIDAYTRVFKRVGLGDITHFTYASGGAFTQFSHEFQTECDAGEDVVFQVPSTGETFNAEIAISKAPSANTDEPQLEMKEVKGEGLIGVEPLAKFLEIPVEKTTKTMLYVSDSGKIIAAAVRGGYRISEDKLKDIVGAKNLQLADEATVKRVTGADVGYAGIINLPSDVQIIVDESCSNRINFEMGSNHTYYHCANVNWGRDLPEPDKYYDIKVANKGDIHPKTGEVYNVFKTAEVGNIFSFGSKKSEELGLYYVDENGEKKPVILGSYGIGITRLMGVIVEKFSDEKGLVWPEEVAPFKVYLATIGEDTAVHEHGKKLYDFLQKAGVSVLYDDRDLRAGEKFATCDMLGIPQRLVVSEKTIKNKNIEFKKRQNIEAEFIHQKDLEDLFAIKS